MRPGMYRTKDGTLVTVVRTKTGVLVKHRDGRTTVVGVKGGAA